MRNKRDSYKITAKISNIVEETEIRIQLMVWNLEINSKLRFLYLGLKKATLRTLSDYQDHQAGRKADRRTHDHLKA